MSCVGISRLARLVVRTQSLLATAPFFQIGKRPFPPLPNATGIRYMNAAEARPARSAARRTWLQRRAGRGERQEAAFRQLNRTCCPHRSSCGPRNRFTCRPTPRLVSSDLNYPVPAPVAGKAVSTPLCLWPAPPFRSVTELAVALLFLLSHLRFALFIAARLRVHSCATHSPTASILYTVPYPRCVSAWPPRCCVLPQRLLLPLVAARAVAATTFTSAVWYASY
jgi:hypothetical protein